MTPDLLPQLAFLIVVIFAASLFQGATGFGFGLAAVAALSLTAGLKVATPLLAVLDLPVIPWRARQESYRQNDERRSMLRDRENHRATIRPRELPAQRAFRGA